MSALPQNSYTKLVGRFDHLDEGDGVTFSLKGPNMTVPLSFYRQVVEYIHNADDGAVPIKKNFPRVSNPAMFTECMLLMIMWEEDVAHGYELVIADHPEFVTAMRRGKDQSVQEYWDALMYIPSLKPVVNYIPEFFIKKKYEPMPGTTL